MFQISFVLNLLLKMTSCYLLVALVWVATGAFTDALTSHSKVQAKNEEHSIQPELGVTDLSFWPGMEGTIVKRTAYTDYGCPPQNTVTLPVYMTTTREVCRDNSVTVTVYQTIISGPCRCDTCSYSPSSNYCTCLPVANCGSEVL